MFPPVASSAGSEASAATAAAAGAETVQEKARRNEVPTNQFLDPRRSRDKANPWRFQGSLAKEWRPRQHQRVGGASSNSGRDGFFPYLGLESG